MNMFTRINEWIVSREITSLETSLDLIRRLMFDNKSIHDESIKKKIQVISEELLSVTMFYRAHLSREESALILETSAILERLWRIYNLDESMRAQELRAIDEKVVASHITNTIPILQKLVKVNATIEAPIPEKTTRVNIGGIWDLAVLLAMNRIHLVYKDMGYVFIGGVAVQSKIASFTEKDVSRNTIISHICRETHDLDVLFPEGSSPRDRLKLLEVTEAFDGLLYDLKVLRDGDRRPILQIDIASNTGNYSVEIYLNFTYTFKDTRNGTSESYAACFHETADKPLSVQLNWNGHPFEFRVIWSEYTILHKLERGAPKDLQDISLLLKYDTSISFQEIGLTSEQFSHFLEHLNSVLRRSQD